MTLQPVLEYLVPGERFGWLTLGGVAILRLFKQEVQPLPSWLYLLLLP